MDVKRPLTIGIVGGMSPESTIIYYRQIIRRHQREFRNHDYPRIVIASVSFQEYVDWQHEGAWAKIAQGLAGEFRALAGAGADFALLATNTMHKVLPSVQSPIPVLDIMDVVARYALSRGIGTLGVTGTKFTMSDGFYARGLEERGLRVLVPSLPQQEAIHRIIYEELIFGKVEQASVEEFAAIAQSLNAEGAEAILLGCTELGLLTQDRASSVELLDSTLLHADAAWEFSLAGGLEPTRPANSG